MLIQRSDQRNVGRVSLRLSLWFIASEEKAGSARVSKALLVLVRDELDRRS